MPRYPSNSALRSGLDAQLEFMTELTRRSYDAVRKLSELNLHFAHLLIQDSVAAARQVLTCSDPLQMVSTMANAAQPATDHVRSYQQQLVGMLTGVQLELTRQAESLMPQASPYGAAMAQSMAQDDVIAGGDVLTNASRANGTATDSTGNVHHQRS
jgi:phasin family protein